MLRGSQVFLSKASHWAFVGRLQVAVEHAHQGWTMLDLLTNALAPQNVLLQKGVDLLITVPWPFQKPLHSVAPVLLDGNHVWEDLDLSEKLKQISTRLQGK